jgi:hypothetical protein
MVSDCEFAENNRNRDYTVQPGQRQQHKQQFSANGKYRERLAETPLRSIPVCHNYKILYLYRETLNGKKKKKKKKKKKRTPQKIDL